jgi:hypothetical protein
MTLDVYAQLEQRVPREHGASFDRLVVGAREDAVGVAASHRRRARIRFGRKGRM